MTPLHRIEERLRALSSAQAFGLVAVANLLLVTLAFALPADGEMRGPAVLSILGNFHILALHVPAAVLLIVPLFEFFERHEEATATVRRLSVFSAAGTWAAVLCGIFHAHFNGFSGDAVQLHLWGGIAASAFAGVASLLLTRGFVARVAGQVTAILVTRRRTGHGHPSHELRGPRRRRTGARGRLPLQTEQGRLAAS